jgi:hypothetical protein
MGETIAEGGMTVGGGKGERRCDVGVEGMRKVG